MFSMSGSLGSFEFFDGSFVSLVFSDFNVSGGISEDGRNGVNGSLVVSFGVAEESVSRVVSSGVVISLGEV
jgi:hypothetical protein